MSKIFLYIDESKDYKNNILYLGGIVTHLGFHAFEKLCQSILPSDFPYELKSTRPHDRQILEQFMLTPDCPISILVEKLSASSDTEYIDALVRYVEIFLDRTDIQVSSMAISADFIRLDRDMRKLQKSLSKKFSNQFWIPIVIEFKNSEQYRSIQFADLAVGIHRRE
jgi:hypothetical protein